MKCSNCGSEWNVSPGLSSNIEICPFCNMPLKTNSGNTVKDALRWIVNDRGVQVFQKSDVFNGLLADLASAEEKERKKIQLALSSGAGVLFYKIYTRSNGSLADSDYTEFCRNVEESGFSSDFSSYILNLFLYAVEAENQGVIKGADIDKTIETHTEIINENENSKKNSKKNQKQSEKTPEKQAGHPLDRYDEKRIGKWIDDNGFVVNSDALKRTLIKSILWYLQDTETNNKEATGECLTEEDIAYVLNFILEIKENIQWDLDDGIVRDLMTGQPLAVR